LLVKYGIEHLPQTQLLGAATGFSAHPDSSSTDITAAVVCIARANVRAANPSLIFDLCRTYLVRQPIPVRKIPGEL
jgi:hypothetical protein